MKTRLGLLLIMTALSACSLPHGGPLMSGFKKAEKSSAEDSFEIVHVTPEALQAQQFYKPATFSQGFAEKQPAARQVIAAGDQVSVTIWEAASGGLFSDSAPAGSNGARATAIPVQQVGSDGVIIVPYVGKLEVSGRAPDDVAREIEGKLQKKAIKPQVLVSIVTNGSAFASVIGDVTGAARVPLSVKGDRLLDVIASAGGIKAMPFETRVRLTRGGTTETVSLDTILHKPDENVFVRPNDEIYVYREPSSYVALGAVTAQKEYPIDRRSVSLAEAIAKAGGLIDLQADSSAVFLFRYEDPEVVRAMDPKSRFLAAAGKPVPVIYRIDFGKPESYFLAQGLTIRDRDLVYVANASSVEFNKFLLMLRNIASIYGSLRIGDVLTR